MTWDNFALGGEVRGAKYSFIEEVFAQRLNSLYFHVYKNNYFFKPLLPKMHSYNTLHVSALEQWGESRFLETTRELIHPSLGLGLESRLAKACFYFYGRGG